MFSPLALVLAMACRPPALGHGSTGESTDSGELGSDTMSTSTTDSETTDAETSTTDDSVPDDDIRTVDPCDQFLQDCPQGEKCVPYELLHAGLQCCTG